MEPPGHAPGDPGLIGRRVVALGASNLARGFQALVSGARDAWGPEVEVLAALGFPARPAVALGRAGLAVLIPPEVESARPWTAIRWLQHERRTR